MAGYVVTGAAVVLPTEDGSERYLYRGAPIGDGFTKEGIKHALSVGLIAVVKNEPTAEELAAKAVADAEKKAAADKAAADKKAADEPAAKAAAQSPAK